MLAFTITYADHCRQVGSFLSNLMPGASRGYLQQLIKSGHLLVNGTATTPSALLAVNDTLSIKESSKTSALTAASRPAVDMLYEDDLLAVVNKEAGRPVHKTSEDTGTDLVVHCERYMERRGTRCRLRPVNRLDRGTSGAVMLAKSPTAAGIMGRFIREHGLGKIYLAAVAGRVAPEGAIALPLEGKESLTTYRLLMQADSAALVAVYPVTGRMHQIRKHFSMSGHPVLGDRRYGGPHVRRLGRGHALHAFAVRFPHPETGNDMTVYAPLPEGLIALVREMAGNRFDDVIKLLPQLAPEQASVPDDVTGPERSLTC